MLRRAFKLLPHRVAPTQFHRINHPAPYLLSSMTTLSGPNWKRVVPADPNIPPYSVFTKPIEKSPRDEREYRIIQLDNGLKATLVHDSETDKAAASLDVAVGHLADPVRLLLRVINTILICKN